MEKTEMNTQETPATGATLAAPHPLDPSVMASNLTLDQDQPVKPEWGEHFVKQFFADQECCIPGSTGVGVFGGPQTFLKKYAPSGVQPSNVQNFVCVNPSNIVNHSSLGYYPPSYLQRDALSNSGHMMYTTQGYPPGANYRMQPNYEKDPTYNGPTMSNWYHSQPHQHVPPLIKARKSRFCC